VDSCKHQVSSISIKGLLQVVGFMSAIATICSLLSAYHFIFELSSHFRLQYFLGALVAGAVSVFLKQPKTSVLFAFTFLVNGWFILPYWISLDEGAEGSQHSWNPDVVIPRSSLTVYHANLLTFNDQHNRLIKQVRLLQPDLISLQEVGNDWAQSLLAIKEEYPYRKEIIRDDNFGIGIYSKIPLKNFSVHYWGSAHVPSVSASIELDDRAIRLITTHPLPPINKSYALLRNKQLADASSYIGSLKGPIVLIGDLNTSPWSYHFQQLKENTLLNDCRLGKGLLPTWPEKFPSMFRIPIDHCLVSADLRVKDIDTIESIGSDHLPLIVTLEVE